MKRLYIFLLIAAVLHLKIYAQNNEIRVAVLGGSSTEGDGSLSFNENVLQKLLNSIKGREPAAVFFTGDLTFGLVKNGGSSPSQDNDNELPKSYGNGWRESGYVYSNQGYQKQLNSFYQVEQNALGKIPFYPSIGSHEAFGPDSVELVQRTFKIYGTANLGPGLLVYSLSIQNAYFVVVQTDYFDAASNQVIKNTIPSSVLDWLENDLKEKSSFYPFIFVFGSAPAFSTSATEGVFKGLDEHPDIRDRFWKILQDNNVLAYFCSHENLYDRTFRNNVWQVISGGAGSPLFNRAVKPAFYHYLLLSIPSELNVTPNIKVIDVNGDIIDTFDLTRTNTPIYQFRISETNAAKK